MSYIPNTDKDRAQMMAAIGITSIDELFDAIPRDMRFPTLGLDSGISELEALDEVKNLASKNQEYPSFLGGGVYNHFVPSVVDYLASRGEFVTPYTPYQPEASQGTLRAHFEFQTMISELAGMDYAIVSHYDGATAFAESIMMAINFSRNKRKKIAIYNEINPDFLSVTKTYIKHRGELAEDFFAIQDCSEIAAVAVQNPDYCGNILSPKELEEIADVAHSAGAKLIIITEPIFLGMFAPPTVADIVVMEGQPLGNYLSFGGPYLGILCMKKEMIRVSTGRIVGKTADAQGRESYVLTLSAREQHIKREKASSNICSNEALLALRSAIYMAAMGKNGMRKVAELCYHKAHYLASEIAKIDGYEIVNDKPFFKEFTIKSRVNVGEINEELYTKYKINGGIQQGENEMIIAVTEKLSRANLDAFVTALRETGEGK